MIYLEIKGIVDEVFSDYSKISMLIICPKCTVRCWERLGLSPSICQNNHLKKEQGWQEDNFEIIKRYNSNPLTKSIVFGGLDSWDSLDDILNFSKTFREFSNDDLVLYTGRNLEEIQGDFIKFINIKNVYVKYGQYNPNLESIVDELTGVTLVSSNQKFIKIS